MLSALLMLRRVLGAVRFAAREADFMPVAWAGVGLVLIGTLTYTLAQDWHVVDAFYSPCPR
jgi:hypothetical protein